MAKIGKILKNVRQERGFTQDELAARLGCIKQTISNYERDVRAPSYETLEALADILNVPMSFFLTNDEKQDALDKIYSSYTSHTVPLIGSVAAGSPILAEEAYDTFIAAPNKATYALRIDGDSMNPSFLDGDIVYIRAQSDVDDGQIGVVLLDDSAAVKHIYHTPTGLTLVSENPKYSPIIADGNSYDMIRILGIVVGYTRMF